MQYRCKPHKMVMAEAVPFGQHWTYHAMDPIEESIKPGYYLSFADHLRVGDSIRVLQVSNGEVIAMAELLITRKEEGLEFFITRDITKIKKPAIVQREPTLRVRKGDSCWEVVDPANKVLGEFATQTEARKALPELELSLTEAA